MTVSTGLGAGPGFGKGDGKGDGEGPEEPDPGEEPRTRHQNHQNRQNHPNHRPAPPAPPEPPPSVTGRTVPPPPPIAPPAPFGARLAVRIVRPGRVPPPPDRRIEEPGATAGTTGSEAAVDPPAPPPPAPPEPPEPPCPPANATRQRRAGEQLTEHPDASERATEGEREERGEQRGGDDQGGSRRAEQLTPPHPGKAHGPQGTRASRTTSPATALEHGRNTSALQNLCKPSTTHLRPGLDVDRSRTAGTISAGSPQPRLPRMQRLSIARSLRLALVALTVALAVVAALGIASLYNSRQRYENRLEQTSSLATAAANLAERGHRRGGGPPRCARARRSRRPRRGRHRVPVRCGHGHKARPDRPGKRAARQSPDRGREPSAAPRPHRTASGRHRRQRPARTGKTTRRRSSSNARRPAKHRPASRPGLTHAGRCC